MMWLMIRQLRASKGALSIGDSLSFTFIPGTNPTVNIIPPIHTIPLNIRSYDRNTQTRIILETLFC
ncbi:hypothetical protein Hanom_Chr07g00589851 [Helianthus anomalus]